MRFALLFAAALPLFGQSDAKPPVTKKPGDSVLFQVFANSQTDRNPLAVQWQVIYPARIMDLEGAPEPGRPAKDAGKSLDCKPTPQKEYSLSCTLSGGNKPIADGPIAIFHFRIHPDAPPGKVTLRVQTASAKQKNGSDAALKNTESTFIIR
jgi:hypothetical protein